MKSDSINKIFKYNCKFLFLCHILVLIDISTNFYEFTVYLGQFWIIGNAVVFLIFLHVWIKETFLRCWHHLVHLCDCVPVVHISVDEMEQRVGKCSLILVASRICMSGSIV